MISKRGVAIIVGTISAIILAIKVGTTIGGTTGDVIIAIAIGAIGAFPMAYYGRDVDSEL
jgi:hypothetical protein